MEPTLRAVLCPCCKFMLYAIDPGTGANARPTITGGPPVQHDGEGSYMKCARCARRVAVVPGKSAGAPSWELAAVQPCGKAP